MSDWTYDPRYSKNIDPPHDDVGAVLDEEENKVADVYLDEHGPLLAAAPDLLLVCETLLAWAAWAYGPATHNPASSNVKWQEVELAIKKATGEEA